MSFLQPLITHGHFSERLIHISEAFQSRKCVCKVRRILAKFNTAEDFCVMRYICVFVRHTQIRQTDGQTRGECNYCIKMFFSLSFFRIVLSPNPTLLAIQRHIQTLQDTADPIYICNFLFHLCFYLFLSVLHGSSFHLPFTLSSISSINVSCTLSKMGPQCIVSMAVSASSTSMFVCHKCP